MNLRPSILHFLVLGTVTLLAGIAHADTLEAITPVIPDDPLDQVTPIWIGTPSPDAPKTVPSPVPTMTATPGKTAAPVPSTTVTPRPSATPVKRKGFNLPRITVIPNPARGTKVTFRVMTSFPVKVRMKVYNRFLDTVATLEGEGDHLFDILWSLKDVPEGPYSFQTQVTDTETGEFNTLPLQEFTVEKDEAMPDN